MENKELISNEYYPLSELFSTENRKIIIPDFQRDYCWGDKTHGEYEHKTDIVSGFLDTLIEEFENNQNSDVLLGKIDVYEHPKNHIYLTDGQQRLTTLYLLIGMLHRKEQVEKKKNEEEKNEKEKSKLKRCLISDFEKNNDDKEPYLQYAVRESTVFFLRDLVNEFFIGETNLMDIEFKDAESKKLIDKEESLISFTIKNQSWYFNEYNLDPSIISMLSALSIIEDKLNEFKNGFSDFIINNIKIQYYDVQDKKHGEERFVIINTTGKGLTASENIKPILLGNTDNFAKEWEKRETWFWKNRNKEKENIADKGVNDFLTWCFQIIEKQEKINIIKRAKELLKDKSNNEKYLKEIQNLFNSLERFIEFLEDDDFQKQFKFINDNKEVKSIVDLRNLTEEKQQNILLPLLAFISKFKNDKDGTYQFLRRLRKNYFDQKWKERNVNYVDWRYVLQIIENEKANSTDKVLQFETNEKTINKIQNVPLNNWFNEEEKLKIELKKENKELIEEWEDHQDFMGDLSFLFKVNAIDNDIVEIPKIDLKLPIEIEQIKKIFQNYKSTVDLIRTQQNVEENTDLANMFRLFRLFISCNQVGHLYRSSWDFEGVLFSTLNREHLIKIDFMKLLNTDNLLDNCTTYVKQKVKEQNIFDLTNFTTDKFIKAWLTLKVFYANQKNELLEFYDGNETGVAAYTDKNSNKLIENEEFSLANSICGFGVKSPSNYVHYTNEDLWCKPNIIDTPFSEVAYEKENRRIEQIEKNKEIIESIIEKLKE